MWQQVGVGNFGSGRAVCMEREPKSVIPFGLSGASGQLREEWAHHWWLRAECGTSDKWGPTDVNGKIL